jgi:hypothetical protein
MRADGTVEAAGGDRQGWMWRPVASSLVRDHVLSVLASSDKLFGLLNSSCFLSVLYI